MKRLPSFNDFSPTIIGDVRKPLLTVERFTPDFDKIVSEWDADYFKSAGNKRARTNVRATLTNLGLISRDPVGLTKSGAKIAHASSPTEGARRLCKHIVDEKNGIVLIDAVRSLNSRGEALTKASLKQELERLGIEGLANATTDHTTLLNWMIAAGLMTKQRGQNPTPDESVMKKVLGISDSERSEWSALPIEQQVFLSILRRVVEAEGSKELFAKQIIDECLRDHRALFREDQIRSTVLNPLVEGGWIEVPALASKGRGGKSGKLKASKKLLSIPIGTILPDFDQIIPADLRNKIDLPREEVDILLNSSSTYERGLGLELLSLKMIIDLGLEPRAFRLRGKDTAYAEVDLTAEGKNLLFSRWNFQCKHVAGNVSLGDVAKEVGLAIYSRAHVVAVVTTGGISSEALAYAREVTATTHLQFLFVPGAVVSAYLKRGPMPLLQHVSRNASEVMMLKRGQPLATNADD